MLRIRIEIVPFGDEDQAYEIGQLVVFNKGQAEFGYCQYNVIDLTKGKEGLYIQEILHRRNLGAWELVRKCIVALGITGP